MTPLRLFLALAFLAATLPFALAADARGRFEIALVVLLLVVVAAVVLPRIGFGRWTRGERAVVLAVLAATALGQLVGDARWTFPFARWEMYGARPDVDAPAGAFELRATVGGVPRAVSLREVFGESGFRVEAALRGAGAGSALHEEALEVIARLLRERTGETVRDLRRVPVGAPGAPR